MKPYSMKPICIFPITEEMKNEILDTCFFVEKKGIIKPTEVAQYSHYNIAEVLRIMKELVKDEKLLSYGINTIIYEIPEKNYKKLRKSLDKWKNL